MIPAKQHSTKRILWVDDEIELLRPHVLFLQARGYHVDAITFPAIPLGQSRLRFMMNAGHKIGRAHV